jgi:hypothetical protein
MHAAPSPLAGKTAKIKATSTHMQYPDWAGSKIAIEDWWDRAGGKSWMEMACNGNPACIIYSMRSADKGLPRDDEVLYGHREDGRGSLVHISELEEETK